MSAIRDADIRAWRLSIEHAQIELGEFDWPRILGLTLDELLGLRNDTAALRVQRDQAQAALAAVEKLHTVEWRYSDSGQEWSCDTPEEAADIAECNVADVTRWGVCSHCGSIERADEDDREWAYRESLWPCPTINALAAARPAIPDDPPVPPVQEQR